MTLLNDTIPFSYIAKQKSKSRHDIYSVISKINQMYCRFSGQSNGLYDCTLTSGLLFEKFSEGWQLYITVAPMWHKFLLHFELLFQVRFHIISFIFEKIKKICQVNVSTLTQTQEFCIMQFPW